MAVQFRSFLRALRLWWIAVLAVPGILYFTSPTEAAAGWWLLGAAAVLGGVGWSAAARRRDEAPGGAFAAGGVVLLAGLVAIWLVNVELRGAMALPLFGCGPAFYVLFFLARLSAPAARHGAWSIFWLAPLLFLTGAVGGAGLFGFCASFWSRATLMLPESPLAFFGLAVLLAGIGVLRWCRRPFSRRRLAVAGGVAAAAALAVWGGSALWGYLRLGIARFPLEALQGAAPPASPERDGYAVWRELYEQIRRHQELKPEFWQKLFVVGRRGDDVLEKELDSPLLVSLPGTLDRIGELEWRIPPEEAIRLEGSGALFQGPVEVAGFCAARAGRAARHSDWPLFFEELNRGIAAVQPFSRQHLLVAGVVADVARHQLVREAVELGPVGAEYAAEYRRLLTEVRRFDPMISTDEYETALVSASATVRDRVPLLGVLLSSPGVLESLSRTRAGQLLLLPYRLNLAAVRLEAFARVRGQLDTLAGMPAMPPELRDFEPGDAVGEQLRLIGTTVFRLRASRLFDEIGLSLKLYRCEHGSYPESPTALVPELLPAVGPDPMTGQPFEYVRTGQGFLLAADRNGANEGFAFLTEK